MLTFEDCLELAALTDGEVEAIARQRHIPAMVALELGSQLLRSLQGRRTIRQFVIDDIRESQTRNDCRACARLGRILGDYLFNHPDCGEEGTLLAQQLRQLVAIGQAEQMGDPTMPPPKGLAATADGIAAAKSRGDCPACAALSLRLMRALERGEEDGADPPSGAPSDSGEG